MPKTNPIEAAVLPLKTDAIERARQEAIARLEHAKATLAEHGGDINAAAPYPSGMGYSHTHHAERIKYNFYHSIFKTDPDAGYQSLRPGSPHLVVYDEKRGERYIQQRMDDAAAQYDAFVVKLVGKIGKVKAAVLQGNHVWGRSTLIVTKPDGEMQAWKTQQIVNYSKLGNPFNQWPTRQLKRVPVLEKAA